MLILVVVLLGLAVLGWLTLTGGVMGEGRGRRDRLGGPALSLGVMVVGGVSLLAVLAALVGMVGLRGGDEGEHVPESAPPSVTVAPPSEEPAMRPEEVDAPRRSQTAVDRLGPVVRITAVDPTAEPDGFPTLPAVTDELDDGAVLRVVADGFEPFARARAEQCATTSRGTTCANAIDVQLGEDGRASFQYLVTADAGGAAGQRCGPEGPRCSLVVRAVEGPQRAERRTVFGAEASRPGRVMVRPRTGIIDGQTVTVTIEGFPSGARARVVLCHAPATGDADRCGPPGPAADLVVGPGGTGRAELSMQVGPVGRDRVRCGRGATCGVAVLTDRGVAADVVPIRFAGPPGPDYQGARLGIGLAIAAVLLAALWWLVRRTDWTPVGEAAAPEIDGAEYADLDAIVAALPPEDPELEDLLAP